MEVMPAEKIRKQVEFYFSDSNLPRDKFLRELTQQSDEGWVSVDVLCSFNRMKMLSATTSTVVEAVKESEALELSEDGLNLRRVTPLPQDLDTNKRSIYAKGFSTDNDGPSIESVEALFSPFGTVKSVRVRRVPKTKKFKGSVFVEFSSEEEASKAAQSSVNVDDAPLRLLMKEEYFAKKREERDSRKSTKETKIAQRAEHAAAEAKALSEREYPKNCIAHFTNATSDSAREDVKSLVESLTKVGHVSYVDFSRGETSGYVRLTEEGAAEAVEKLNKEDVTLRGAHLTWRALEDDEEKQYWIQVWSQQAERRRQNALPSKRKGGRSNNMRGKRSRAEKEDASNDS